MRNYQRSKLLGPVFIFICLFVTNIHSQNTSFIGTFTAQNGAFTLRLKPMTDVFHGTLQTSNGVFPLKATVNKQEMNGIVYTEIGNYKFTATPSVNQLTVLFEGNTYQYYQISQDHQLEEIDLTPYFKKSNSENTQPTTGTSDNAYYNQIASSQLVFYQRTSYLNDSNASSLTYVNFCPDGRFGINYEGSFSVEGDYGGNAQGAGYGTNRGTWKVITHEGGHAVQLLFANGEQGVYPINPQHLQAGRWRIGNTQYALQKGKVFCR